MTPQQGRGGTNDLNSSTTSPTRNSHGLAKNTFATICRQRALHRFCLQNSISNQKRCYFLVYRGSHLVFHLLYIKVEIFRLLTGSVTCQIKWNLAHCPKYSKWNKWQKEMEMDGQVCGGRSVKTVLSLCCLQFYCIFNVFCRFIFVSGVYCSSSSFVILLFYWCVCYDA